jgi:hypothetical protein
MRAVKVRTYLRRLHVSITKAVILRRKARWLAWRAEKLLDREIGGRPIAAEQNVLRARAAVADRLAEIVEQAVGYRPARRRPN